MRIILKVLMVLALSITLIGCKEEKVNESYLSEDYFNNSETTENDKEKQETSNSVDNNSNNEVSNSESGASEQSIEEKEIGAVEVVSNIIPFGDFEIDREETREGIDYVVVRCTDPETKVTIGWYYVRKEDKKLFELNLSNNTLMEVIQTVFKSNEELLNKLIGHWESDNGAEYWFDEEYVYCKSISGITKDKVRYISEKEKIKTFFSAFEGAEIAIDTYNSYDFLDIMMHDEVLENCIVVEYPSADGPYHSILYFEDTDLVYTLSKYSYDLFLDAGYKHKIDNATEPN